VLRTLKVAAGPDMRADIRLDSRVHGVALGTDFLVIYAIFVRPADAAMRLDVRGVLHTLICKNGENRGLASPGFPSNAVESICIVFLHPTCAKRLVYRLCFTYRSDVLEVLAETVFRKTQ
jgi:hypothetical protein